MKPELNKWQFTCVAAPRDYRRMDRGWKYFGIGLIKIHTFPNEGCRLEKKKHYKGFLLSFYYFFPIEME